MCTDAELLRTTWRAPTATPDARAADLAAGHRAWPAAKARLYFELRAALDDFRIAQGPCSRRSRRRRRPASPAQSGLPEVGGRAQALLGLTGTPYPGRLT